MCQVVIQDGEREIDVGVFDDENAMTLAKNLMNVLGRNGFEIVEEEV